MSLSKLEVKNLLLVTQLVSGRTGVQIQGESRANAFDHYSWPPYAVSVCYFLFSLYNTFIMDIFPGGATQVSFYLMTAEDVTGF